MTTPAEAISNFLHDLNNNRDKWDTFVVDPFAKEYKKAFKRYQKTLADQKEADAFPQWVMSLSLLALSLCGGGVLTAAFGTAAAKTIAGTAAQKFVNGPGLDYLVRNNMERGFRAAGFFATNKVGNFIAEKVWDAAESGVSGYVSDKYTAAKAAIDQNRSSYPSVDKFAQDPQDIKDALGAFVGEAKIKCYDLAAAIRDDPKVPDEKKASDIMALRKATIFNPPQKSIVYDGLAEEIELAFYLLMVLDLDHLETDYQEELMETHGGRGWRRTGFYHPNKSTPINQSPSEASYPKSTPGPGRPGSQAVSYGRLGGVIGSRLDALYKNKFNTDFLPNRVEQGTLVRAEKTIELLANGNIKRLIGSNGL